MRQVRWSLVPALMILVVALLPQGASARLAEDPLSGAWSGSATSPEGGAPIKLTLKLDGQAVTGQIATDQGSQDLKEGTWKDGVLSFKTTYNGVPVSMKASLKEGKLAGDFSYNEGEVLGTWTASREPAQQ